MTPLSRSGADSAAQAGSPSPRPASSQRLISWAVAAVAAVGLLAGCGGSAPNTRLVASTCAPGKGAPTLKLVLSDRAPIPRAPVALGTTVEVVSHFARQQMTFPAGHPSADVCELSQQRGRSGTATAIYRVVRPGTITFSSTYTHATNAMMPEMLGQLTVAGRSSTTNVATARRPNRPVWCPTVFHAQTAGISKPNHHVRGSFDTRPLIGRSATEAEAIARQDGCSWRIVNQRGLLTLDGRANRVDVDVTNGKVTAVGVY